jgi:hypothetical protein
LRRVASLFAETREVSILQALRPARWIGRVVAHRLLTDMPSGKTPVEAATYDDQVLSE